MHPPGGDRLRIRPEFTARRPDGFARIALGVHYLSDVIGAVLIGTVWLIGMVSAFQTWRREEGKPVADVDEGLEPEHRERLKP